MIQGAIIGLGRWGRSLVEASHGHARLKIVRAVEPDLAAAQDFCSRHHLQLADDLKAVLADPAIDAVLLATPHSLHPAQVIACAAAAQAGLLRKAARPAPRRCDQHVRCLPSGRSYSRRRAQQALLAVAACTARHRRQWQTGYDPSYRRPQQQRELAKDHRRLAIVAGGIARRRADRRRIARAGRLCQHAGPGAPHFSAAPFARAGPAAARYGYADDGFRQRRHRNAGDRQGYPVLLARACVRNAKAPPRCWTRPH